jgi:hypothetical protein
MWVTTHVLAGLGLAALLGGPWWLVLVVVVLAHVLMDLIPHWDYGFSPRQVTWGVVDFCASLAAFLLAWLAIGMPLWMALMGLLSGAPDWDVLISKLRGDTPKLFPSHWQRFPHGRAGKPFGIGVQVVIMAASVVAVAVSRPF